MEGRNEAGWWKEGKNQTDSTGSEEGGDTSPSETLLGAMKCSQRLSKIRLDNNGTLDLTP